MQHHPHDDTSLALLGAAHRLLAAHGSEALTVRRIATEAGMSTMNVYSRFGGKDGVIDELYIDGFVRLFEAINAVPVSDDFSADLIAIADAYRDFAIANPTYYKIMFRAEINEFKPSDQANQLALSGLESFVGRIYVAQKDGHLRNDPDYPPEEIAAWLWAICHGMVSLELFDIGAELVSWASVYDHGVRAAIDGLQPSIPARR